jgi:hypothetical protein
VTQAWFNQKEAKTNKMKRTKNQKTKLNQNRKIMDKGGSGIYQEKYLLRDKRK